MSGLGPGTSVRAPGLARLRLEYESFGRPASMTFHAHFDSPPTTGVLRAWADQAGLWENSGFGLGYATLRDENSSFTNALAWSLDPLSDAAWRDQGFNRPGVLIHPVSSLLPTTLAPMIYWNTSPPRRRRGRTYCVGLTELATYTSSDAMYINNEYGDALVTIFNDLIGFTANAGGTLCLISTRSGGLPIGVAPWFPIVSATNGDRLMGSQRRRTRHGRG